MTSTRSGKVHLMSCTMGKFLVFMYFDWKALVFGRFWQTLFLWFSTSKVMWIGLSLLGWVLWWVSWTCCLMEVLWLGSSLLQYKWKPLNVQDESFVDFYFLHNDEYMFCNVLLTSCVLTFKFWTHILGRIVHYFWKVL
jgi:hypothetical protein